ncbi:GIY-YIG nuclease family protein, partial [Enterococcus faecalis]|uniref:GIY-YIG nuclease family protein n=1 Tax=Enterococcus faecalis TaxID=1351 RepID=UPI001E30A2D8
MYYVYMLVDPRNNQPFYVGKGSNDRVSSHTKNVQNNPNNATSLKDRIILEILTDGLNPVEHILEDDMSESDAYE